MTSDVADSAEAATIAPAADTGFLQRHGTTIEYILIPGAALAGALVVFGIFVALFGKNPLDLYFYMYQGAFGTWFWIDPTNDVVFVGMIQNVRGSVPGGGTPDVRTISPRLVYTALTEKKA